MKARPRIFQNQVLIFLWDLTTIEIFYVCQLPVSVWKAQLPHLAMQLHRHSKLCTRLASSFDQKKKKDVFHAKKCEYFQKYRRL